MKPLLGNTDSLQLFPLAYPWAWDMYLENMDNHWTPREIPVADDVALWRSDRLSDEERHLFLSVMAQLTTFDVQRGDETGESLQGIMDPPEIKHYLKRLADEEALHCYAEGTEILTERGWVDFRDLSETEIVAQFDNGSISFVHHLGLVRDWHDGEMILFKNQAMESLVTPNHWCIGYRTKDWKEIRQRAESISLNNLRMPVAAFFGDGHPIRQEEQLRIAFQADGHRESSGRISFNLKKKRKIERLRKILAVLEIEFVERVYNDVTRLSFHTDYVLSKSFDWVPLAKVSFDWCRSFVQECLHWDGSISKGMKRYFTNNYHNASIVQAVAALGGYHGRLSEQGGVHCITFVDKPTIHAQTLKRTLTRYRGWVYSVGVPSRNLVVRYKGNVLISQNTWAYQYIIENMGLDPEDIYSRYGRVPEMKARVDLANELSSRAKRAWAKRIFSPEAALTVREKQEILFAMIFWFLCFEGVWFVMGLSGPIQNLSRHGKLTGAAEQFQYILRDEFQHIRFGTHLINVYIEQYPECMSKSFVEAIGQLFQETIRLEDDYMRHCLPSPIVGYNAEDHVETARWYANLRAESVGLEHALPGAQHMFPWMSEQMTINKEKNFFETRVTEYRTGGALNWDD